VRRLAFLAAMLVVAGCGQHRATVPANAIALVGGQPVSGFAFDSELARARRFYHGRARAFPAPGTVAYQRLKDSVVRLVVERKQLEIVARKHGVSITPAQIDRRLRVMKQTTFGGSQARYRERLRLAGMTDADVRDAIRVQLLTNALRKDAPAAMREQLPVVYAKGFAPANAG
jgi:SurA-like protein